MKEYFLVAIADRDEAVKALRERRQLLDVQITVAGQATDEYLEWLDVRPGEIFCVMAVSRLSPLNAPRNSTKPPKLVVDIATGQVEDRPPGNAH